jgi:hypothetical protein
MDFCSKDIDGGQSKSVLRRLQQACFLPKKMFHAAGSCRHGYILVGAFWSFEIF